MKSTPRLTSLLVGLAICALVAQAISLSFYTVDDAFISARYARNLVEGQGLVFNPGERVEGYTNFLWTLLMAGAIYGGIDPLVVSKVLGIVAAAGTVYLVYRFSVLARPKESPWFLSMLAVALLSVNGAFATAAITGLETSLFTFLVVAGAYGVVRSDFREQGASKSVVLPPVFFALSALVRPEGVIMFGVSVGFKALSRSFHRDDLIRCGKWLATFGAIYMPYFIWRIWYYGELLPNTFYAKTGAGIPQYYKGILDLKDFSLTYWGIVFLLALIVLSRRKSSFWLTYVTGMVVTVVFLSIYEGGDWIPFYRFLVPALPFYYLVIQEAMGKLYADVPRILRPALKTAYTSRTGVRLPAPECPHPALSAPGCPAKGLGQHPGGRGIPLLPSSGRRGQGMRAPGRSTVRMDLGFLIAFLILVVLTARPSIGMYERLAMDAKGHEVAHFALGKWLKEQAQGPIALMDIGEIGYISRLPVIDTSGLVDRTISHSEGGLIDKKFDLAYVLNRQPQHFILASTTDFLKLGTSPTGFPIERRIYEDARFHQYYSHKFTLDSGWEVDGEGYYLAVYERK